MFKKVVIVISILVIIVIFFNFSLAYNSKSKKSEILTVSEEVYEGEHKEIKFINRNEFVDEIEYKKYVKKIEQLDSEAILKTDEINNSLMENINSDIFVNNEKVDSFNRIDKIVMSGPQYYSDIEGITCFRGNNYRNSASFGIANIKEEKLEIIWNVPIGAIDSWTGVGWNGQPSIIKWSDDVLNKMNIFEEKKQKKDLKEVIYGTLDSNIYFMDLEDGSLTRNRIKTPGPIKGSISIDPRGLPLLYTGQGINKVNGKYVSMGYRIFSLINQEQLYFINGIDSDAYRSWSAFDSTSIIDKNTDSMIVAGENGLLYTIKLNTKYDLKKNSISIAPDIIKYRYAIKGNDYQGIENSVAIYKNMAYFADNGGWIQSVDLNTMKPVWIHNATDDTDSTIAIEEINGEVWIYTASEVDKQGNKGKSYIRKLDALSGKLIWEKSYECFSKQGERPNNGGALASPVVGKGDIDNLIIYSIARSEGFNRGILVALDKLTGEEVWKVSLDNYSWSSPVDVYTEEGHSYILHFDSAGKGYLIEGSTGKILDIINLGSNVEGSPAVYENIVVVGTRGQKIYGIKIK